MISSKFIQFVLWQVQIIGLQGKEQDMVTGKRKKMAPLFLWNGRGLRQEFHQTNAGWNVLQGSWLLPFSLLAPFRNIAQDFLQILLTMPSRTRYIQLRGLTFIFLIYLLLLQVHRHLKRGKNTKKSINIHYRQAPGFNRKFYQKTNWVVHEEE